MGKLKIQINNMQNLRDLLQEAYFLADAQIQEAQNEINKMANATKLQEETIEGKAKYGKIINDYLGVKDKAISKKLEISKILSDLMKINNDINNISKDGGNVKMESFDFEHIKKMVDNSLQGNNQTVKTIEINK